jgi:hypothetical protein
MDSGVLGSRVMILMREFQSIGSGGIGAFSFESPSESLSEISLEAVSSATVMVSIVQEVEGAGIPHNCSLDGQEQPPPPTYSLIVMYSVFVVYSEIGEKYSNTSFPKPGENSSTAQKLSQHSFCLSLH